MLWRKLFGSVYRRDADGRNVECMPPSNGHLLLHEVADMNVSVGGEWERKGS